MRLCDDVTPIDDGLVTEGRGVERWTFGLRFEFELYPPVYNLHLHYESDLCTLELIHCEKILALLS